MKVLNLQCAHGHSFEGWFSSNDDFAIQAASGLVSCPLCSDTAITKGLTAPRLNLGHAKPPAEAVQTPMEACKDSPEKRWMRAVREVMAKTEDVGSRFVEEARKMHYGEAEERSIRGQATFGEVKDLAEEGITVLPLPLPPALKETLQ